MDNKVFNSGIYKEIPFNLERSALMNFYLTEDIIHLKLAVNLSLNKDKLNMDIDDFDLYGLIYIKAYKFELLDYLLVEKVFGCVPKIYDYSSNNGIHYLKFENSYVDKSFIKFKADEIEIEYLSTEELYEEMPVIYGSIFDFNEFEEDNEEDDD